MGLVKSLRKIQKELHDILMEKSREKINDGSSEAFQDGVSSGFYDAAAITFNYFKEMMNLLKEQNK